MPGTAEAPQLLAVFGPCWEPTSAGVWYLLVPVTCWCPNQKDYFWEGKKEKGKEKEISQEKERSSHNLTISREGDMKAENQNQCTKKGLEPCTTH